MHGALLQVVMALRPTIASLPADPMLARLIAMPADKTPA